MSLKPCRSLTVTQFHVLDTECVVYTVAASTQNIRKKHLFSITPIKNWRMHLWKYTWILWRFLVPPHYLNMDWHMTPVFTFRRLDFIIPSADGYVKTHSSWSIAQGCVLKNLQGWADLELVNTNKPISLYDFFCPRLWNKKNKYT